MPIIEPPKAGTPLSQGDILKGVPLYFSKQGEDATWVPATGKKQEYCLVLSRQCVVEHKTTLTVASIEAYPTSAAPTLDFQGTLLFLGSLRDGDKSPDLFYLGQLPGDAKRFVARLDFLATIEIPARPEVRQLFIDQHRVARLEEDYIRDLHLRIFQAFVAMGYVDYKWVSDADLRWLVQSGNSEISKYEADWASNAAAREASGTQQAGSEANKISDIRKRMEPYQKELERRFPSPSTLPAAGSTTEAGTQ